MNTFHILFSLLIPISATVFSQPDTVQQDSVFGQGRVKTTEGNEVAFTSITLGQQVHTYKAIGSTASHTIDIANVSKVEVRDGSYMLKAGVSSAVVGLVVSVAGIASWNKKMGQDALYKHERTYVVLGSTVGCALVGGLIGLAIEKHKTVYSNPGLSIHLGLGRIELSFL